MFWTPVSSMSKPLVSSSIAEMRPLTSTSPLVWCATPVMILRSVDLPDPFLPRIAMTSPCGKSTDDVLQGGEEA